MFLLPSMSNGVLQRRALSPMPYEYSGIDVSQGDPEELFNLVEMVGRGAYGAVWKAQNIRTAETVAVKLIPCNAMNEGLDAVRREIAILKDCQHQNIVQYASNVLPNDWDPPPASTGWSKHGEPVYLSFFWFSLPTVFVVRNVT